MPQSELISKVQDAYIANLYWWLKSQGALRGLLSLQLLGNPGAMFNSIGAGFSSLFIDPAHAALKGPEAFGKSLGSGVVNFGAMTVGGLLGFAGDVTGSAGKVLTRLAMDDKYAEKRAKNLRGKDGLGSGAARGAKQFGRGLFEGVTGLITQPIKVGER